MYYGENEQKWLTNLPTVWKQHFRAKRYMDDILVVAAKNQQWDHEQLEHRLSACYEDPLKLEKGKDGIFLETKIICNIYKCTWRQHTASE